MKTIITSFEPWIARDIVNGDKTIDVRKSVPAFAIPDVKKTPEAMKVLMYVKCTPHWFLYRCDRDMMMSDRGAFLDTHYNSYTSEFDGNLCGSVIGEFTCEKVNVYGYDEHIGYPTPAYDGDESFCDCGPGYWVTGEDLKKMHILNGPTAYDWLVQFGDKKTLYGFEVKDPVLYEVPRVLQYYGFDGPPKGWKLVSE